MECSICTEYLHSSDTGATHTLECGHTFHASCVCTWFRQGNASCPNCRDVGTSHALCWADSQARASVIRRRARNKTAPEQLKQLVKRLQNAEATFKQIRKEMTEFRKQHTDVFKTWTAFRPKLFAAQRLIRKRMRAVGTFASPEFPLPNIQRIA